MLLGIGWYRFVRSGDVRRLAGQPRLTAVVRLRRLALFGHIVRVDDGADAGRILLASPLADWGDGQAVPLSRCSALSNRI